MNEWLAVLGTLAGAAVGGGITFFAQRMSMRHARQTLTTNFAEDRARWAAERQLAQLQAFYAQLHQLTDSVSEFRMFQARKAFGIGENGKDRGEYNKKRGRYEIALEKVDRELLLLNKELRTEFLEVMRPRHDWLIEIDEEKAVGHLMELERRLSGFADSVAERVARVFEDRREGKDLRAAD